MAGVKIGRVNGQFVVNPDLETLKTANCNLVVAGTADAVMMVEAGANELPEATMLEAIEAGSCGNQKDCRQDSRAAKEGRQKLNAQVKAEDIDSRI